MGSMDHVTGDSAVDVSVKVADNIKTTLTLGHGWTSVMDS